MPEESLDFEVNVEGVQEALASLRQLREAQESLGDSAPESVPSIAGAAGAVGRDIPSIATTRPPQPRDARGRFRSRGRGAAEDSPGDAELPPIAESWQDAESGLRSPSSVPGIAADPPGTAAPDTPAALGDAAEALRNSSRALKEAAEAMEEAARRRAEPPLPPVAPGNFTAPAAAPGGDERRGGHPPASATRDDAPPAPKLPPMAQRSPARPRARDARGRFVHTAPLPPIDPSSGTDTDGDEPEGGRRRRGSGAGWLNPLRQAPVRRSLYDSIDDALPDSLAGRMGRHFLANNASGQMLMAGAGYVNSLSGGQGVAALATTIARYAGPLAIGALVGSTVTSLAEPFLAATMPRFHLETQHQAAERRGEFVDPLMKKAQEAAADVEGIIQRSEGFRGSLPGRVGNLVTLGVGDLIWKYYERPRLERSRDMKLAEGTRNVFLRDVSRSSGVDLSDIDDKDQLQARAALAERLGPYANSQGALIRSLDFGGYATPEQGLRAIAPILSLASRPEYVAMERRILAGEDPRAMFSQTRSAYIAEGNSGALSQMTQEYQRVFGSIGAGLKQLQRDLAEVATLKELGNRGQIARSDYQGGAAFIEQARAQGAGFQQIAAMTLANAGYLAPMRDALAGRRDAQRRAGNEVAAREMDAQIAGIDAQIAAVPRQAAGIVYGGNRSLIESYASEQQAITTRAQYQGTESEVVRGLEGQARAAGLSADLLEAMSRDRKFAPEERRAYAAQAEQERIREEILIPRSAGEYWTARREAEIGLQSAQASVALAQERYAGTPESLASAQAGEAAVLARQREMIEYRIRKAADFGLRPEEVQSLQGQLLQIGVQEQYALPREQGAERLGLASGAVSVGAAQAGSVSRQATLFGGTEAITRGRIGEADILGRQADLARRELAGEFGPRTQSERLAIEERLIRLTTEHAAALEQANRGLLDMRIQVAQAGVTIAGTRQQRAYLTGAGGVEGFGYAQRSYEANRTAAQQAREKVESLRARGVAEDNPEMVQAVAQMESSETAAVSAGIDRAHVPLSVGIRREQSRIGYQTQIMGMMPGTYGSWRGSLQAMLQSQEKEAREILQRRDVHRKASGGRLSDVEEFAYQEQLQSVGARQASTFQQLSYGWESRMINMAVNTPGSFAFISPSLTMRAAVGAGVMNPHMGLKGQDSLPFFLKQAQMIGSIAGADATGEGFGVTAMTGAAGRKEFQSPVPALGAVRAAGDALSTGRSGPVPVVLSGPIEIAIRGTLDNGQAITGTGVLKRTTDSAAIQPSAGGIREFLDLAGIGAPRQ